MTTTTNRAIQIQPTGLLLEQHIPADSGDSIRALVGCRTFDVISLEDTVDTDTINVRPAAATY